MEFQSKLQLFLTSCQGKKMSKDSPVFMAVTQFIRTLQPHQVAIGEKEQLKTAVCECFDINEDELIKLTFQVGLNRTNLQASRYKPLTVDTEESERALDSLIPNSGYFRHYVNFTHNSEAPLAYHFFSAVIGISSVVNRRVFIPWGVFNYYPATGVILIGPSGVKKTSSSDIIVNILQELQLIEVYAESITPEDLVNTMKGGNATGLIYAPEMATFYNKKDYKKGLVELVTRWMDCPNIWKSSTLSRGKAILTDVGISSLVCSTSDWFIENLPEGTFGGGFIARFLMVVQDYTARVIPKPLPPDSTERDRIKMELHYLHSFFGEMQIPPEVEEAHNKWYRKHKKDSQYPEHELLGTYFQRKQGHVIRLAMCLHLGTHYDHDPMILCLDCHNRAIAILDWNEQFLPNLFKQLFKSVVGIEQETVYRTILSSNGAIGHSDLVRKLQHKFDAAKVKNLCQSLKEANMIREEHNALGHMYILTGEK